MNKETLRALVGAKLTNEIRWFRDEELSKEKEEILGDCFKVNMSVCIYEVLYARIGCMNKRSLNHILEQENVIEHIYENWIEEFGDDYERIEEFVLKEVVA